MDNEPPGTPEPTDTPPTTARSEPRTTNNWRLYLELASFANLPFPPIGCIIGPLVLWLIKREDPAIDAMGKKVLNFNISWTIWTCLTCGLGFFPWLVIAIIAAVKAANNEIYDHPLTIELLR